MSADQIDWSLRIAGRGETVEFELRGPHSDFGLLRPGETLSLGVFAVYAEGLRGLVTETTIGFSLDDPKGWVLHKGEVLFP